MVGLLFHDKSSEFLVWASPLLLPEKKWTCNFPRHISDVSDTFVIKYRRSFGPWYQATSNKNGEKAGWNNIYRGCRIIMNRVMQIIVLVVIDPAHV